MNEVGHLEAALLHWTPPKQADSKLELYLEELRSKFNSDPDFKDEDWKNYLTYLQRHFDRIEDFLVHGEGNLQNLVLGNVQSGKTGHLMANICWAHDQDFALVILLTGTKNTLDEQTAHRLKSLSQGFSVTPTPTKSDSKEFGEFCLTLRDSVRSRVQHQKAPLAVITLIKQQDRLEALTSALSSLNVSENLRVLIIDDEADQASPDGETALPATRQRKDRTIHKLLGKLVDSSPGRTVYLSYTATPQAILHQDIDSLLQPRYCSIVPSGPSYFGLNELLKQDGALGAIEKIQLSDNVALEADEHEIAVLESAFIEFLILSWVHKYFRSEFHNSQGACSAGSVQMLVHPSGKQEDHGRFKSQLDRSRKDILIELQENNHGFVRNQILPIFKTVTDRIVDTSRTSVESKFGEFLDYLIKLLQDENLLAIKLINSTERSRLKRVNKEKDFIPVSDSDWLKADAWVLIGGDILGRGLTIPHLVSTFFLRFSKSPNFDTSVQQMRFCGYRNSYKHLLKVYAPQIIVRDYQDAAAIDAEARNLANYWDISGLDLLQTPPPIRFSSPEDARFSPTRRNVMSLAIRSAKLGGTAPMFALSRIASRMHFESNIDLLKRVAALSAGKIQSNNQISLVLTPKYFRDLLQNWQASESEGDFRALSELVEADVSGSGLKKRTIRLVFPSAVLENSITQIFKTDLVGKGLDKKDSIRLRSLSAEADGLDADAWLVDSEELAEIPVRAVVGDSERAVRDSYPDEIVIHAQIFTLVSDGGKRVVGQGVSLIGWAPRSGSRVLVHGQAIS